MPPTDPLVTCGPPVPTVAAVVATEFVVVVWRSARPPLSHPV